MATTQDKKRANKLQKILTKLQNGENVENRVLRNNLTDNEFAAIENDWNDQKELREELKDKPREIIEYEQRVKEALFAYNKYDTYKNKDAIKKAKSISDSHFERLNEYLQEIMYADPSLREWFDRNISFEHGEEPGLDPISIPRVVGSRSLDCQSDHFRKLSKNQVKQNVIQHALDKVGNQANPKLIKDKLKKLKASMKK